ncbi:hypothetical protein V8F33_006824 [Rhypophila sp. PSN 637]
MRPVYRSPSTPTPVLISGLPHPTTLFLFTPILGVFSTFPPITINHHHCLHPPHRFSMNLDQSRRRPTSQIINMSSTTRRLPPILFLEDRSQFYLPSAPDPPFWSLPPRQNHHCRPSNTVSSIREPYHVTSSNPATTDRQRPRPVRQRSPSPIPIAPGAPRIPLLSDSDVEEEDKELAGMDRGYLRLGGRRLYLPSPPPTPEPLKEESQEDDFDDANLSKMNDQLDFARQYIQAQAQMAARRPGPRVIQDSADNSAGNDGLQRRVSSQNAPSLSRELNHERRLAPFQHRQTDQYHWHEHEQPTMARAKQLHSKLHFKVVVDHGRETRYLLN